MRNAGLDEAQAGIKIVGRNIYNLRYADDSTYGRWFMAESEEKLESLDEKEKSEKAVLKLNVQKTKIMASSPITSWQIDGETMETVTDFIFLGSKITADGDCSHEIKRGLLLGRKAITNLNNMSLSRLRELVIDREAWRAVAHAVAKSLTRLSNWTELMTSIGASQVALVVKNLPTNTGDIRDASSIPALGRSPGRGHGNPLHCSCLENPMARGAWKATVHRFTKKWAQLKWPSTHMTTDVGMELKTKSPDSKHSP